MIYPVTRITSWETSRPKGTYVTDRRRKDYGSFISLPSQYEYYKVNIFDEAWCEAIQV